MTKRAVWLIVLLLPLAVGCGSVYYRCSRCGAAYKGAGTALPGMRSKCRRCDGRLLEVGEQESGWNEERFKRNGNEIK